MSNTPETDEFADGCINPDEWVKHAQRLEYERNQLRAIFPKILIALGNGGECTPNASIEFLEEIPKEIELVIRNRTMHERDMQRALECTWDAWTNGGSLTLAADLVRPFIKHPTKQTDEPT